MSQNPLNLAVRFMLESAALIAIGYGGWHVGEGFLRYLLAIGLPLLIAYLWGAFRTPNEPHHPTHPTLAVPGWGRLLVEAVTFGGGAWGLFSAGATTTGWLFTIIVIVHYAFSYDRIIWLLRH
jgi:hypothetical protein